MTQESQEHLSWLDKPFLASFLQREHRNQVTIDKFSIAPAVAAGNNYMSYLYRVRVEYTVAESDLKVTSLIIKIPITKGVITEMSNDGTDLYDKEPRFYCELLPKINKIFNCEFGPKSYNCPIKNGMILTDLIADGYITCDKYKLLDYSHCKCVISTLAKFHASSVVCFHDNPELIKEIGEEQFFTAENETVSLWLNCCMKSVWKVLCEMEGQEQAANLYYSKIDHVTEIYADLCKPKTDALNVLNHGDLWVNNILFKHSDSGEVKDAKFIDFQTLRWGSPVSDLLYFIWTSANEEVREHRQTELYSLYRQTLNSSLEQLGCLERLSDHELEDQLRAASDFVLLVIGGTLPYMMCDADEVVNTEDLSAEDFKTGKCDEVLAKLFNSRRFKAALPKIMEQFQIWVSSK
ncbi:uncharacterized protein LOC124360666 isoform X1 [Homalodisca vitripennis]|uniref:uncharacterized protein LOC124360666 isoform X1 n=1 Tax=Homalodisca vitripennis TaxID=197043 RepID=UPI001EEC6F97|nr:uncharacterized protein LOC124360666 isoform X1 [Homalodisca vitripennis]